MPDHEILSGLIRLHVLYHASREGLFGLGMIHELRNHGYKIGPGTLYPLLHRMEEKGYLRSTDRVVEVTREDLVSGYVGQVAPELEDRLERYDGERDVFAAYRIDEQIHKALERKVHLPSGGSLVIDRTEAMTVVDVNTGKFVGKSTLEETVHRTNKEAAVEVSRQLRLRDIGGIIVIDFIDMEDASNREDVFNTFRKELEKDRTRTQVFEISPLGLVQMTRKNVSAGIVEAFSDPCPTCEGRGILIHDVD